MLLLAFPSSAGQAHSHPQTHMPLGRDTWEAWLLRGAGVSLPTPPPLLLPTLLLKENYFKASRIPPMRVPGWWNSFLSDPACYAGQETGLGIRL